MYKGVSRARATAAGLTWARSRLSTVASLDYAANSDAEAKVKLVSQHRKSLMSQAIASKDCKLALEAFTQLRDLRFKDEGLLSSLILLVSQQPESSFKRPDFQKSVSALCEYTATLDLGVFGNLGLAEIYLRQGKESKYKALAISSLESLQRDSVPKETCVYLCKKLMKGALATKSFDVAISVAGILCKRGLIDRETLYELLQIANPPLVPHSPRVIEGHSYSKAGASNLIKILSDYSTLTDPILEAAPTLMSQYIDILGYLGKLDEASRLLNLLSSLKGVPRKVFNAYMRALMLNGNYDGAFQTFKQMEAVSQSQLKSSPDIFTYNLLLWCLCCTPDRESALVEAKRVLSEMVTRQIVPNVYTFAHYTRIVCLSSVSGCNDAIKVIDMVRQSYPELLRLPNLYFVLLESLLDVCSTAKESDAFFRALEAFLSIPEISLVSDQVLFQLTNHRVGVVLSVVESACKCGSENLALRALEWALQLKMCENSKRRLISALLASKFVRNSPRGAWATLNAMLRVSDGSSFREWFAKLGRQDTLVRNSIFNYFLQVCLQASKVAGWNQSDVAECLYRHGKQTLHCGVSVNTIAIAVTLGRALDPKFVKELAADFRTAPSPPPKKGKALKNVQRYRDLVSRQLSKLQAEMSLDS